MIDGAPPAHCGAAIEQTWLMQTVPLEAPQQSALVSHLSPSAAHAGLVDWQLPALEPLGTTQ